MRPPPDTPTWFGHSILEPAIEPTQHPSEFDRVWRGFMTARVTLGLMLLLVQGSLYLLGTAKGAIPSMICAAYLTAALVVRIKAQPRPLGQAFDSQWVRTVGVDILAFAALQIVQDNSINYAPLFALPVLMISILGSMLLAMGAAAGVTLMLFSYALWISLHGASDPAPLFLQAALTGAGCFAIAFLTNQVASRLANVELKAQRSQLAVQVHRRVNELIIESLSDGILVVGRRGMVRSANPAARRLLGPDRLVQDTVFDLTAEVGWHELVELMKLSFLQHHAQHSEVIIHHQGQGPRRLRVHTQLTASEGEEAESLCVMFLQDQREMEARMRTEKLASMGRMSAAVAHEIRNPLAAIVQANALLEEDLSDTRHTRLTRMVQQNAARLGKIVDEVLDLSRAKYNDATTTDMPFNLSQSVERICRDWQLQTGAGPMLGVTLPPRRMDVRFEPEHLRRVLVNLLDNARRYASQQPGSVQVTAGQSANGCGFLSVWSDGPPMDQSVERHLFEPFFSSESRSSGLGLYICRELCESHGATITYQRRPHQFPHQALDGNEFLVCFRANPPRPSPPLTSPSESETSWLPTQF